MKKFKLRIFMIATVAIIVLNIASLSGLEAYNTQNKSHYFLFMMGSMWQVLRFPVFTFFWKFIYTDFNIVLFSTAVFIDCVFYGLIVERIFYLFGRNRNKNIAIKINNINAKKN
ncbi:MAG TPA: hypothetical protein VFE04_05355 [Puia sp.]|nr:hypothetical protein [Puia sp.]